ncbi:zinc knuckle [Diaporthe helianthi]|uniref:Zinc knuckle n=1 Tax=Diaporthe helianthi TaxID=158607 RepID=A0A2P5HF95_DIAHE|nr:zinc knuckle [Diaporthe helianthi]
MPSNRTDLIQSPGMDRKVTRLPLVGFLVSKRIDHSCYTVKEHSGPNENLAATLTLETDIGAIEIHNVYNPEGMNADKVSQLIDIDALRDTREQDATDHNTWRDHVDPAPKGSRLPGAAVRSSTIDLMFASQALAEYVPKDQWRVMPVAAFKYDHHLIGATILTCPNTLLSPRFCWNLDPGTTRDLQELVKANFAQLSTETALNDEASTEEFAVRCSDALKHAALQCVPTLHPLTNRLDTQHQIRTGSNPIKQRTPIKFFPSTRKRRRKKFRKMLSKLDSCGLYRVSRQSAKWRKPRPLPHMPSLVKRQSTADGTREEPVERGYEEGRHFFTTIHGPNTGDLRNPSPPRMPDESLLGNSDESVRVLRSKEVSKIYILNHVYTAWSIGQKLTVMGLDITGAYPRVNSDRLLEAMARKNVPAWIILFVFSWLYESQTDLHLPGRRPEGFFISLGIPQGSSLSPILFLFFASGLLQIDLYHGLYGASASMVSFVDDTYLIVRSSKFRKNCDALKTLHDRVLTWAQANDVEFAPHKYGLLHFERQPKNRCTELPNIPGLTPKHLEPPKGYKVPHLRTLGVIVDSELKWGAHIEYITRKVQFQQHLFGQISQTQSGPNLHQMRQLYMAKVLPIFSYACGAWYLPRETCPTYMMCNIVMRKLDIAHQAFLLAVSGGMKNTTVQVIFKELHVHRMSIFLEKIATAQRARELDTPQHRELCLIRMRAWASNRAHKEKLHPYYHSDKIARALLDSAFELPPVKGPRHHDLGLKGRLKELVRERAEAKSRAAWEQHKAQYINNRENRRIPPAYSDPQGWGSHNLDRYASLPRHQSSMLFQCRAERAAVNATLYVMRVHKDSEDLSKDTPSCPCGHPKQTIEHLFSYCPDLEEARAGELVLKLGTKNVDELLEKYPAEASAFAVRHFGICKNTDVPLFLPQPVEEEEEAAAAAAAAELEAKGDKKRKRKREGEGGGHGPKRPAKSQKIGGAGGAGPGKDGFGVKEPGARYVKPKSARHRAYKARRWKKDCGQNTNG